MIVTKFVDHYVSTCIRLIVNMFIRVAPLLSTCSVRFSISWINRVCFLSLVLSQMLKRLSYPLTWMEGLTGEKEQDDSSKSSSDKVASLPNSADSHHSSVFSKVFSR